MCVCVCVCDRCPYWRASEQSLLDVFIQEEAMSVDCVKVLITCRTAVPRLDRPWVSTTKLLYYYVLFIVHECIANHQLWQICFSFIKRPNFSEKNIMIYYSSLRDWTQYHCLNKSSSCILMTVCILRESFWSICIYSEYELKIYISSAELCSTYEWLCKYKVDLRT